MSKQPWQDTALPFEERVHDLVGRMTLEEKMSQLRFRASALYRFGIPEYSWWNECLHGVARAGNATVFPQAIGMGAMFNPELVFDIADAISTEARAKHHEMVRHEDRYDYKGLTFWSPNINIFRDPRWGRGHETYGEDPYLTGRCGVAFCKGLQGEDSKYFKTVATPKHYAAHSGPETTRRGFNAEVSEKDLRETYLPAFAECVREAGAYSVMGAYNAINGEPCCGSPTFLQRVLRDEWGFDGYVVSDCWAVMDFHEHHHFTKDAAESAAMALNNGCDLNCGVAFDELQAALDRGLITEEIIDISCRRVMTARMKLGMFDPPEDCAYAMIPFEKNDCDEHHQLSLQASRESVVLLKNDGILPLKNTADLKVAVIGPNAMSKDCLLGNYFGSPSVYRTLADGLRDVANGKILYAEGCCINGQPREGHFQDVPYWGLAEAVAVANCADVVVLALGLDHTLEGEEGDKETITLPETQIQLFDAIAKTGKKLVLCNFSGSAVDLRDMEARSNALIQAWYPGQFGGLALAEIIYGTTSPSGRLPITFYRDMNQVPDFSDYSMDNRTYRFFDGSPLYPFGYGLSYSRFAYENLSLDDAKIRSGQDLRLSVDVVNTGDRDAEESVQIYIKDMEATTRTPRFQLCGLAKPLINAGGRVTLSFTIPARRMAVVRDDGSCVIEAGSFTVYAGGQQPDGRSAELTGVCPLEAVFDVVGADVRIPF